MFKTPEAAMIKKLQTYGGLPKQPDYSFQSANGPHALEVKNE